jgi:hypothetical protein
MLRVCFWIMDYDNKPTIYSFCNQFSFSAYFHAKNETILAPSGGQ